MHASRRNVTLSHGTRIQAKRNPKPWHTRSQAKRNPMACTQPGGRNPKATTCTQPDERNPKAMACTQPDERSPKAMASIGARRGPYMYMYLFTIYMSNIGVYIYILMCTVLDENRYVARVFFPFFFLDGPLPEPRDLPELCHCHGSSRANVRGCGCICPPPSTRASEPQRTQIVGPR